MNSNRVKHELKNTKTNFLDLSKNTKNAIAKNFTP